MRQQHHGPLPKIPPPSFDTTNLFTILQTTGRHIPPPDFHCTKPQSPIETMSPEPSTALSSVPSSSAHSYESTHVHAVYDAIAPHFSSTRHKPWPFVSTFLLSRPAGSVGLDVGCGNGKYLPVNPKLHILGSDRSHELVKLAHTVNNGEVAVADGLDLPYPTRRFDFAICIAVIHHFSTRERRQHAISALLDHLRDGPDAHVLVYVWALEQKSSRRGWDEDSAQDTLVPWVMRSKGKPNETFQRYYHLFKEGELEEDVRAAGGVVVESGYERDNWWVICTRSS